MKILRIRNEFRIPEQFDVVNLIENFKPMLMRQIETKSAGEQEALEVILGNASADIPILVDCDDLTISGKIKCQVSSRGIFFIRKLH